MNCCKKEEDCCPCESMAPRIECLQAQIDELKDRLDSNESNITHLLKMQGLQIDINQHLANFDKIQMIINEMNDK